MNHRQGYNIHIEIIQCLFFFLISSQKLIIKQKKKLLQTGYNINTQIYIFLYTSVFCEKKK